MLYHRRANPLLIVHEQNGVRLLEGPRSVARLTSKSRSEAAGVALSIMVQGQPAVFSSVTERSDPNGPKVLSSVASVTKVTLLWPAMPTARMYKIYKDDRLLGQTSATSFDDIHIPPGASRTPDMVSWIMQGRVGL